MFDFAAFLSANWKDSADLHRFLLKFGVRDYTAQAVYKWWSRASVPADAFAVLACLLEVREGVPVSLVKWLKS